MRGKDKKRDTGAARRAAHASHVARPRKEPEPSQNPQSSKNPKPVKACCWFYHARAPLAGGHAAFLSFAEQDIVWGISIEMAHNYHPASVCICLPEN